MHTKTGTIYSVGGPYFSKDLPPFSTGCEFNCRDGMFTLTFSFLDWSEQEINDIQRGDCEFGVYVSQGVLFFLYRFGSSFAWSDAPFNFYLLDEGDRRIPTIDSDQTRALLSVFLVDANVNRILAMRAVTVPPAVTRALIVAIEYQSTHPLPIGLEYTRLLKTVWNSITSAEMAQKGIVGKGGV